jgi:hypothetical protein
MYQWQEKRETRTTTQVGGGQATETRYSYDRTWSERAIASSSFQYSGHDNPPFPFFGETFAIAAARLGAFRVDGARLAGLGNLEIIAPDRGAEQAVASLVGGKTATASGMVWTGDPQAPRIGDLRVSWLRAVVAHASLVGRQSGDEIGPYRASNGRELFFARAGNVPADEIFRQEATSNTALTWVLRVVGMVIMYGGFAMSLRIFRVAADVVPPLGRLAGAGIGLVAAIATLMVGALAIGLGWVFYRPLLGATILAVGIAAAWLLPRLAGRRPEVPAA